MLSIMGILWAWAWSSREDDGTGRIDGWIASLLSHFPFSQTEDGGAASVTPQFFTRSIDISTPTQWHDSPALSMLYHKHHPIPVTQAIPHRLPTTSQYRFPPVHLSPSQPHIQDVCLRPRRSNTPTAAHLNSRPPLTDPNPERKLHNPIPKSRGWQAASWPITGDPSPQRLLTPAPPHPSLLPYYQPCSMGLHTQHGVFPKLLHSVPADQTDARIPKPPPRHPPPYSLSRNLLSPRG